MAGISRINTRRAEEKANRPAFNTSELWLRDGDVSYVAIVPDGSEEDQRLDDFFVHTEQFTRNDGGRGFRNIYCPKTDDNEAECGLCASQNAPGHRFGFWCYVFYTLHSEKRMDDWTEVADAAGAKKFKEEVADFRVFSRGFGRQDYLWNYLVDIHAEVGSLSKNVTRIRRTGATMKNTSYLIAATPNEAKLTSAAEDVAKSLPGVREYAKVAFASPKDSSNGSSPESFSDEIVSPKAEGDVDFESELF